MSDIMRLAKAKLIHLTCGEAKVASTFDFRPMAGSPLPSHLLGAVERRRASSGFCVRRGQDAEGSRAGEIFFDREEEHRAWCLNKTGACRAVTPSLEIRPSVMRARARTAEMSSVVQLAICLP